MAKAIFLGGDKYDKAFKPLTYLTDKAVSGMPYAGVKHLYAGTGSQDSTWFSVPQTGITVTVDDKVDIVYHITTSRGDTGWIGQAVMDAIKDISHKTGGVLRHLYTGLKHFLAPRKVVLE